MKTLTANIREKVEIAYALCLQVYWCCGIWCMLECALASNEASDYI
jgi:hypothetical protein